LLQLAAVAEQTQLPLPLALLSLLAHFLSQNMNVNLVNQRWWCWSIIKSINQSIGNCKSFFPRLFYQTFLPDACQEVAFGKVCVWPKQAPGVRLRLWEVYA